MDAVGALWTGFERRYQAHEQLEVAGHGVNPYVGNPDNTLLQILVCEFYPF